MRAVTWLPFSDTQCGFKLYRREAARVVFARQQLDGFGFDVEDLYIARVRGFRTVEVAVRWNNVEGTKVSLVNGLRPFFDLLADSLVSPGRPLPAEVVSSGRYVRSI